MKDAALYQTVCRAEMRLDASPGRIFPLLCPVREAEWLPGWQAEVLHSNSGFAELGCVFLTQDEDGYERVWTISRHDPVAGALQFVQFMAGLCVIRLDIQLEAMGQGTNAEWTYSVSALEPGHEDFFAFYGHQTFRARMSRLEELLNVFLNHAAAC